MTMTLEFLKDFNEWGDTFSFKSEAWCSLQLPAFSAFLFRFKQLADKGRFLFSSIFRLIHEVMRIRDSDKDEATT